MNGRSESSNCAWTPDTDRKRVHTIVNRARPSCRAFLERYAHWLEQDRGLLPSSVAIGLGYARVFLEGVVGEDPVELALPRITPASVEEYFVRYHEGRGRGAMRSMQGAMRGVLRYGVHLGWVSRDVADSVPKLRKYRLTSLPRGIKEAQVKELLDSFEPDTHVKTRRDRALILLLATYGVRTAQICSLLLDDVDWRRRRIKFRACKLGKPVSHGLTSAVAEILALYIREYRPKSDSEHVFLRCRPPHLPTSPAAVRSAVRKRLRMAGIAVRPLGPHAFRHGFAARLVNSGHSLKTTADLLGHRCLSSTAIYAKVDKVRLSEVALEWPEVLQ